MLLHWRFSMCSYKVRGRDVTIVAPNLRVRCQCRRQQIRILRFESAPDGTLIPIPSEFPPALAIREDAQITVNNPTGGFYVVIFNGPSDASDEIAKLITEVTTEAAITRLEHLLASAAATGAKGLIKFGGLFVSVAISVFTPSPILRETYFRGYLPDGTPIRYVVLTPQQ